MGSVAGGAGVVPVVSIIVPSYQGAQRLPTLMRALAAQATDVEWEVIVVLDGSTDESESVVEQWRTMLPLRLIPRAANRGRSATLNEGFAAAAGAVLIRCDDDLEPRPGYIARFAELVLADPDVGVVGLYRNEYPQTRYATAYGRPVDRRFRAEAYAAPASQRWRYWAGNCAVHRRMWELVGPYDESFREYGWEDVDWGYRFMSAGGRIVLEPELETPHRVAAVTTAIRLDRARLSGRASVRFARKHGLAESLDASGMWGRAVAMARPWAGESMGGALDRVLPILPRRTKLQAIDLGVQAAFARGAAEA